MARDGKGLDSSMWASRTRTLNVHRTDTRSRSVPPAASSTTPAMPIVAAAVAAPANSSTTTANGLSPAQAFHRFEQACHRLRWKFVDLQSSYKRAMGPADWGFSEDDAERNFKVDFHEFYMWIEQALVLLLLVWGVSVPRAQGQDTRSRGAAAHAYHHNVLKALEIEPNPLFQALGQGDVNHALWKAKELRNRWKDAAEGRETPPLKMYDLTWIVTQILTGLEVSYGIAGAWVEEQVNAGAASGGEPSAGEDSWEWMVEPMDWEA